MQNYSFINISLLKITEAAKTTSVNIF